MIIVVERISELSTIPVVDRNLIGHAAPSAHGWRLSAPKNQASANRPVFVVGCPRSGTTFLYDMLLSSRKFAHYRAESDVFYRIAPAFGSLAFRSNRAKLMDAWLQSDYFRRTRLDSAELRERVLSDCRNPGDFLRIVMEAVARRQGVPRWAENTPFHIHYMKEIKRAIPDAMFVHIIRDGRDVAVSLNRLDWPSRFSWDSRQGLAVSALWWQWHVAQGRKQGRRLGRDYLEIRYEELVGDPQNTLAKLGEFIGEDLNYEHIQRNAVGTVARPNSSFSSRAAFRPIGRWRELSEIDLAQLNDLVGPLLRDLGYPACRSQASDLRFNAWRLSQSYQKYWWLKRKLKGSFLSRLLVSRDRLERGALDRFDAHWEEIRDSSSEPSEANVRGSAEKPGLSAQTDASGGRRSGVLAF